MVAMVVISDLFLGAISVIIGLAVGRWTVGRLMHRHRRRGGWWRSHWGASLGCLCSLLLLVVGGAWIWAALNQRTVEFTVGRLFELPEGSAYVYDTNGQRFDSQFDVFAGLRIGQRVSCQATVQILPIFDGTLTSCVRSPRSAGEPGRRALRCSAGQQDGASYGAYNASQSCWSADSLTAEGNAWGISDSAFLRSFAIACGTYLLAILALAHAPTRRHPPAGGSLGTYELAMLTGGSVCMLTAAAASLHAAGALRVEQDDLVATEEHHAVTNAVERELVEALHRDPGILAHELREQLRDSPATKEVAARLAANGLLPALWRITTIRRLHALAIGLVALSIVRVIWAADAPPDGPLPAAAVWTLLGALLLATGVGVLFSDQPPVNRAGRRWLALERERQPHLRTFDAPTHELALAVALFGSEPLRTAAPELAAAWGIVSPEEMQMQAALLG